MIHALSIADAKKKLTDIVNSPKTTVVFDTNAFRPFLKEKVPGLDLSEVVSTILDGYHITRSIIKQRLYNEETAQAAKKIHKNNMKFIDLLKYFFKRYSNLVLSVQVKQELERWIREADIKGYEEWKKNRKKLSRQEEPKVSFFQSQAANDLVRIRRKDPYFPPIFEVEYEYKKALRDFIAGIPSEKVIEYPKSKLQGITGQFAGIGKKRCNSADKVIFGSSVLATIEQSNENLVLVSSDDSMKILAERFDPGKIRETSGIKIPDNFGIKVLTSYSCKLDPKTYELTPQKFDLVYPTGKK